MYVDIVEWAICNIPGLPSFSVNRLMGEGSAMNLQIYELKHTDDPTKINAKEHSIGNKNVLFSLVLSQQNVEDMPVIPKGQETAYTGRVEVGGAPGASSRRRSGRLSKSGGAGRKDAKVGPSLTLGSTDSEDDGAEDLESGSKDDSEEGAADTAGGQLQQVDVGGGLPSSAQPGGHHVGGHGAPGTQQDRSLGEHSTPANMQRLSTSSSTSVEKTSPTGGGGSSSSTNPLWKMFSTGSSVATSFRGERKRPSFEQGTTSASSTQRGLGSF